MANKKAGNKQECKLTEEEQQMVVDNYNLIHAALKKFPQIKKKYEDYEQVGALALCKAAQSFDKSKGFQFSSFATSYINFYVLSYYRNYDSNMLKIPTSTLNKIMSGKESFIKVESMDSEEYESNERDKKEYQNVENKFLESENDIVSLMAIEEILKVLTDEEKELVRLLMLGYKQTAIAEEYGVTRACISARVKKIREKIKIDIDDLLNL